MTPERYQRLEALFLEARGLVGAPRAEFLGALARSEPDLSAELELMLRHDTGPLTPSDGLMQGAGARFLAEALHSSQGARTSGDESAPRAVPMPRQIGRFTIIRLIGQGGMGTVYEAEQDDPKRRVALKVIRDGFASAPVLERFHREAQMLGRLHHRGIAQIYDARTSPDPGEPPYFVMELVDGPPLLKFAEAARLDVRQRLEVIAEICDALEHAHISGLIHRDLKPGNILVQPAPAAAGAGSTLFASIEARVGGQPKILDFGVAHGEGLNTLTDVQTGRLIGTVPYMSPEQATGAPLDARSDIYSMGVIVFELLAGRLPYDLAGKMLHEAARIIRDEEPTRLGAIDRRLRGDVETVVAKALEKDRERRYASAADLAADIRRHLADQPIVARPPSLGYRAAKLLKRRTSLVAGVSLAAATALVAIPILFSHGAARRSALAAAGEEGWRRYVGAIGAAAAAVENLEPDRAREFLSGAEMGRDAWEYRHLVARLSGYGDLIEAETPIVAAAACPEGGRLVTCSRAGVLQWWDSFGAEVVRELALAERVTGPAAFSGDGVRVAATVGAGRDEVIVWECESGRQVARLTSREIAATLEREGSAPVTTVAISPDGERVALSSAGGVLWRLGAGAGTIRFHADSIACMCFSGDSRRLVVGHPSGNRFYGGDFVDFDADSGVSMHASRRVDTEVIAIAAPAGGERPLVGTKASQAMFINLDTNKRRRFSGHPTSVTAVADDPQARYAVTGMVNGLVQIFDRSSGARLHRYAGPGKLISWLAFNGDGSLLLAIAEGKARVYRVRPFDAVAELRGHEFAVMSLAFRDDNTLVTAGADGAAGIWNVSARAPAGPASLVVQAPPETVLCAAVSPDGRWLATGHDAGLVCLRVVGAAAPAASIRVGTDERVAAIALSPDGRILGIKTVTRVIAWDSAENRRLWEAARSSGDETEALTFSADGSQIAWADAHGVRVWDSSTGELQHTLGGSADRVAVVAFSPEGSLLCGGARDGSLRVWDLRTGSARMSATGHSGRVRSLVFTPDGARLASGSDDRSVLLWDTTRWEPVLELAGHRSPVLALRFSADALRLASGSEDHVVRIWEAVPPTK